MEIRTARATDFTAIAAITNHYIATTAIHFAYEPVTDTELRAGGSRIKLSDITEPDSLMDVEAYTKHLAEL